MNMEDEGAVADAAYELATKTGDEFRLDMDSDEAKAFVELYEARTSG